MKRRKFITLLGGAAAAWPFAARAQRPAVPVIGFIRTSSPEDSAWLVAAVRKGLTQTGYIEGHNVVIEYRFAQNQYNRLPEIAAELVRRNVSVIVATGGTVTALAAKAATSSIPIVFTTADDAVKVGLVASYNRPGGNATGVSVVSGELAGKRLGLLRELVPKMGTIAVLVNPNNPSAHPDTAEVQAAAQTLGLKATVTQARTASEIDLGFDSIARLRPDGLYVSADTFFTTERGRITTLAARYAMPTVYATREYPTSGGLMSYGVDWTDIYRHAGIYAGRILKGMKPADLPVLLPTKFELIINLKTAKALGLSVPDKMLVLANEVIE